MYFLKIKFSFLLEDASLGLLPGDVQIFFIRLMTIAVKSENGGELPTVREIAYTCHLNVLNAMEFLETLEEAKLVRVSPEGTWSIPRFYELQDIQGSSISTNSTRSKEAERAKRYRDRKKGKTNHDEITTNHDEITTTITTKLDEITTVIGTELDGQQNRRDADADEKGSLPYSKNIEYIIIEGDRDENPKPTLQIPDRTVLLEIARKWAKTVGIGLPEFEPRTLESKYFDPIQYLMIQKGTQSPDEILDMLSEQKNKFIGNSQNPRKDMWSTVNAILAPQKNGFKGFTPEASNFPSELVKALANVCQLDYKIPATLTNLRDAEWQLGESGKDKYTAEYILIRYGKIANPDQYNWYQDNWKGQKGQAPTLKDIIDTITAVKPAKGNNNGHRNVKSAIQADRTVTTAATTPHSWLVENGYA